MKGFRDFVLRGNLIELAVAFIIGAAFAALIKSFTEVILEAIGKASGGADFNFDDWAPGGWTTVGPFLTALIAFLIMAFVVYFFVFGAGTFYLLRLMRKPPNLSEPDIETGMPTRAAGITPAPALAPSSQTTGRASSAVLACHQVSATTATALSPTCTPRRMQAP